MELKKWAPHIGGMRRPFCLVGRIHEKGKSAPNSKLEDVCSAVANLDQDRAQFFDLAAVLLERRVFRKTFNKDSSCVDERAFSIDTMSR